MSVQIALGAPATRRRVAEARAGRRQPLTVGERRRGLRDEHVGEHVRQVRDGGEDPVVGRRRRSRSAARRVRRSSRCRRSYSTPDVARGRRQVPGRPSNRSARACSTPAVSAPASGWPPTNRGSSWAATTARLVEPTSVTTQSGGAASRASPTKPREAADRRRDEHHLGAVDRLGHRRTSTVERPALERASQRCRVQRRSRSPRPTAARGRRAPTEPPISPTPRTATRIRRAAYATA